MGEISIPQIEWPFQTTVAEVRRVASKYLLAVQDAGKIYRHIVEAKGGRKFITEVSMDETDQPADAAGIADYPGRASPMRRSPSRPLRRNSPDGSTRAWIMWATLTQFEKEFNEDLAVIDFAVQPVRSAGYAQIERAFRQRQVFHLRADAPRAEQI